MKQSLVLRNKYVVVAAFFVLVLSLLIGCSGSTGPAGPAGAAGTSAAASTGTVSGKVETSTGTALSGITVSAYVYNSSSATGYKQSTDANQNYQNAKALLASSSTPVATTTTAADGSYSLSVAQGVYTVVFSDPNGNYTIGSQIGLSVTAGATQTVNAGMGSSITVGSTTKGDPTVTVAPSQTVEVGYGNPVTLTATASSPISGVTLSYKWTATAGSVAAGTPASTATLTMPTLTQALAGTQSSTGMTYTSNGVTATYSVPPFQQDPRIGVLPITADTRGSVSTTVTVSDGQGGTTSASVSSNAAGTQTGLNNVPVGEPVYLNSGYGTAGAANVASWSLTSVPAGSKATLSNATTRNASFTPDVAGTYVVKDSGASATSTNTLTIYAGTWQGVIKGGGETTATIPATGFTAFQTPAGGTSQLDGDGIWGPAGTYTDFPYVTVDTGCTACHANGVVVNGLTAPDKFTPWTGTAHATFFARGLNNITANSGSCMTCHTVGYDQAPNAANNGFDDVAALDGWAYPTKQAGQWKTLVTTPSTANLAQLSNIQCENCHGPQQSGAHISGMAGSSTGTPGGTRVSYSAEDCGICHASGTGHVYYSEWVASLNPDGGAGHSKLAQLDAAGGHVRSMSPYCSRCHTAEGFAAYANQLTNNTPGGALTGSAAIISPSKVVWTGNNVHSQTCTACHDPHNDANPYQLRIYDKVSTMTGMQGSGYGAGAICMECHNLQGGNGCAPSALLPNGVCQYTTTPYMLVGGAAAAYTNNNNTFNPDLNFTATPYLHEDTDANNLKYTDASNETAHDNSMAEVLLGRNAFFMGGSLPMVSPHASVKDTCVGCHMTLNPNMDGTKVASHVWYIRDSQRATLCANCHGGTTGDVDGSGLVSNTQAGLTALANAMGPAMLSNLQKSGITQFYVGALQSTYAACGKANPGTLVQVSDITSITGSGSFTFNLKSTGKAASNTNSANPTGPGNACTSSAPAPSASTSFSLYQITVDQAGTTPLFPLNSVFKKAKWNYTLISNDKSYGIHNPQFVTAVLSNTLNAINNAANATSLQ